MSKLKAPTSKLNLSQVGRVCVSVADPDRAIEFYVEPFSKRRSTLG